LLFRPHCCPNTFAGTVLKLFELLPSWPAPLEPQQYTVLVPAVDGARTRESAAVSAKAGRQPREDEPAGHRLRQGMRIRIGCPGTELATYVLAPAVGFTQEVERAGMAGQEPARRNRPEGEVPRYRDWYPALRLGSIAQLAPIVASPAVDCSRAGKRFRGPRSAEILTTLTAGPNPDRPQSADTTSTTGADPS
jgi:hypothetical protein